MAPRKSFLLRLPPDLHDELRRWAEHDLRSLNAQIEFLLREALRRRGRAVRDDTDGGAAGTTGTTGATGGAGDDPID